MGEGDIKPKPEWARRLAEERKRTPEYSDDLAHQQNEAFRARRARRTGRQVNEPNLTEEPILKERPKTGPLVRERAIAAVRKEKEKKAADDRLTKAHAARGRRARSSPERRGTKAHRPEATVWNVPSERVEAWRKNRARTDNGDITEEQAKDELWLRERAWRLGILLRAGAYDRNRFKTLPETVTVTMRRWQEPAGDEKMAPIEETLEIPKSTLDQWLKELQPHERQRLYVIGRKRLEFPFREEDYPEWIVQEGDSEKIQSWKRQQMEKKRRFQEEQKELADALEVVAVPMLKGAFAALDHENVNVYLSGLPDDLAGGIDTIVEFKDAEGNQKYFSDGSPMVLVIDVTYARMKDKIPQEMKKGRISEDAQEVLKGGSDEIDPNLSNARATKLFRTVVETLGRMSTQTFDEHGPLGQPREHLPRLIVGLEWDNAFQEIIYWTEQGDAYEKSFGHTGMARRIATSVRKQLEGLHALVSADQDNPNTRHLSELLKEIGTKPLQHLAYDEALNNLDNLLTTDQGYSSKKRWKMDEEERAQLARRKTAWRLRQRFVEAARAQVTYDRACGGRHRGDRAHVKSSVQTATGEADWQQQLAIALEEKEETTPTPTLSHAPEYKGGVSLSKYDTQAVIEESPSERATELLRDIRAMWEKSEVRENGERVVVSKKGKKEISWGEWLVDNMHDRIRSWSDKEKAYIRTNLPRKDAPMNTTSQPVETVERHIKTARVHTQEQSTETSNERVQLRAHIAELKKHIQVEKNRILRERLEREKGSQV